VAGVERSEPPELNSVKLLSGRSLGPSGKRIGSELSMLRAIPSGDGVMEYWSIGECRLDVHHSMTPLFHDPPSNRLPRQGPLLPDAAPDEASRLTLSLRAPRGHPVKCFVHSRLPTSKVGCGRRPPWVIQSIESRPLAVVGYWGRSGRSGSFPWSRRPNWHISLRRHSRAYGPPDDGEAPLRKGGRPSAPIRPPWVAPLLLRGAGVC
jgi:hypothetical protein